MNSLPDVVIHTDGACSASGTRAYHGGYAGILVFRDKEKIVRGHLYPAKNGGMELQALIAGLEALTEPSRVEFYSDAQYLVNGVNLWMAGWIKKGWPDRVLNQEYWKRIAELRQTHIIHGNWIRGHAPKKNRTSHQEYNVRCDEIAVAEAWLCFEDRRGPIGELKNV